MPPVALAAGAAAAAGIAGGLTTTAILINVGIAVAMAGLQILMVGKPKGQGPIERRFTVRSAQAPRQVVYGATRVKDPVLIHQETTNNKSRLHWVVGFAGHEITAFDKIWFGDEEVGALDSEGNVITGRFAGYARVRAHLGAPDQVADSVAISELAEWSATDIGAGIAYLYITFTASRTIWPSGVPAVSALIRGKAVYSYIDQVTRYTDNAALIAYDYLRDAEIGFGATAADIDPELAAIDEAVCDEYVGVIEQSYTPTADLDLNLITLDVAGLRTGDRLALSGEVPDPLDGAGVYYWIKDGPTTGRLALSGAEALAADPVTLTSVGGVFQIRRVAQRRYTSNGTFLTDRTPLDVLEDLVGAMAGTPMLTAEGYRLRAGADQDPVGALNLDMVRGDIKIEPRRKRAELYNAVGGTFTDADQRWTVTDFPEITSTAFQAADGGERIRRDITLEFCDDGQRAQRLALIDLAQSRQAIRVEWPGNFRCLPYERGDLVTVTLAGPGWVDKKFWVARDAFAADGQGYDLTLLEAADGLFDLDLDAMLALDPAPDTGLLIPGVVDPPAGLSYHVQTTLTAAGDSGFEFVITGDASPDAFVIGYRAELKEAGAVDYSAARRVDSPQLPLYIGPIAPTIEYDLRLAAFDFRGAVSSFVEVEGADANGGDVTAPATPTGLANTAELVSVTPSPTGITEAVTITGGGGTGAAANAVSVYGGESDPDTFEINVTAGGRGFTSAPTVTGDSSGWTYGPAVIGNPTKAHLVWTDPIDADLERINIYRGPDSNFANASLVASALVGAEQGSALFSVAAGLSEWFFVSGVDTASNESAASAGLEVTRDA